VEGKRFSEVLFAMPVLWAEDVETLWIKIVLSKSYLKCEIFLPIFSQCSTEMFWGYKHIISQPFCTVDVIWGRKLVGEQKYFHKVEYLLYSQYLSQEIRPILRWIICRSSVVVPSKRHYRKITFHPCELEYPLFTIISQARLAVCSDVIYWLPYFCFFFPC
jgi:hypothetical protein